MTPASLDPFLYLTVRVQISDRWEWPTHIHLRRSKEVCDHPQHVRVALGGVVEPGSINERHVPPIQRKFICKLDFRRARLEVHSDP